MILTPIPSKFLMLKIRYMITALLLETFLGKGEGYNPQPNPFRLDVWMRYRFINMILIFKKLCFFNVIYKQSTKSPG